MELNKYNQKKKLLSLLFGSMDSCFANGTFEGIIDSLICEQQTA